MSGVQRDITGATLTFSLSEEMGILRADLEAATERIGRTLLKNGPLRATLVGLKPGGSLRTHHADGPITVHVLEGSVDMEVGGTVWPLPAGTLFSVEGGLPHSVTSVDGGIFLLTVVAVPAAREAEGA